MSEEVLFRLALEQPPAERAAFLDKMCGGDNALRQCVEAQLRAHDDPGDFLARPPVRGPATIDTQLAADGPGSRVGPYKLLQQIGEGGMGTVFMAEQSQPVQRKVALKLIKPGMDSRQVIARFEAERQALALMDHPNIAKVLDAGTTVSGRPYFVMELVKGVPITKYCDEHRLTPKERLELFVAVCRAVQHAHQKGIIHRDLKPSNVLIAQYDGKPVPKVIDFGVAKATGSRLTDKTLFTDFGAVVGTLEYMSPEQAELNQLDIDTRSDIYALGVLLYELLTGTTPLSRKRLKEAALLESLRIIREEEPPKPSTRLSTTEELPSVAAKRSLEPKKLSGLVRGDLDWIAMKCLEKDRNRRYETANGLASDVQRYLADEPVLASPPSTAYQLRKFARRHKAGMRTTAVVLLVAFLAAGGVGWALWDRASQEAQRSAETERAVSMALVKAEQLAEQARGMPSVSGIQAAAVLVVWRQAEDALAQASAALNTGVAGNELRQRVAALASKLEGDRRQTERGRAYALRKEKLFRDLDEARMARLELVDNHRDYSGCAAKYAAAFAAYGLAVTKGDTAELARQIAGAEPELREALSVALDDWAFAATKAQTAPAAIDLRALAEAADSDAWRKRFRAASNAKDRTALRDLSTEARRSSLAPSSLVLLALELEDIGEHDDARSLLRYGRGRHPTDFWMHFELGAILIAVPGGGGHLVLKPGSKVEVEESIGCYRAALALRPFANVLHNNLGSTLFAKNELDDAIAEFKKAIVIDPKHVNAHYNLGLALAAKNQLDAAIAEYKEAIKLDPKYASAHNNLGAALQAKNELDDAVAEFKLAIDLVPKDANSHGALGQTQLLKGRFAQAKISTQEALNLLPDKHDLRPMALRQLQQCERCLALEAKLADILAGQAQPTDNRERLGLIEVCRLQQRNVAATRLYADAFSADTKLADDLKAAHRYNAACAAALAAAGKGTDADKLGDKERAGLRKQALEWLRADLDLWSKHLESGKPQDRKLVQEKLRWWQKDTDLAGIRDKDAVAKHPAVEREACQQLWADVAKLLEKAGDAK
jgi:serine/threonine protein kinase/tetratricopeptide (TPR) repeat protein